MPQRAASPERGCTKAAYPSGSASASPVGSTARSPGASSASTAVTTSAPASPGSAYAGSGTPGSRRWTRTSTAVAGSAGAAGGRGTDRTGGNATRLAGQHGGVPTAHLGSELVAKVAGGPPVDRGAGDRAGQERGELGHAAAHPAHQQ